MRTVTDGDLIEELAAALQMLNPAGPFEVRTFDGEGHANCQRFAAGQWQVAVKHAAIIDESGDWSGIYTTFNPLLSSDGGAATNDDVERRLWLYLDIDPDRIGPTGEILCGIPATDLEASAARCMSEEVLSFLNARGWVAPLSTFTGNGYANYFPIDLPNDDDSSQLIKRVLGGLAKQFDRAGASLDLSVSNASRVTRIPGTMNRKGQATAERPHRRATMLSRPGFGIVGVDELRRLADLLLPPDKSRNEGDRRGHATSGLRPGDDFDRNGPPFDEILERHDWKLVRGTADSGYWRRPGKGHGISATTRCRGSNNEPLFHVFSSNAPPFEEHGSYGKFRTLAQLECQSDLSAAAKRLYAAGYGERMTSGQIKGASSTTDSTDSFTGTNNWTTKVSGMTTQASQQESSERLVKSTTIQLGPFTLIPQVPHTTASGKLSINFDVVKEQVSVDRIPLTSSLNGRQSAAKLLAKHLDDDDKGKVNDALAQMLACGLKILSNKPANSGIKIRDVVRNRVESDLQLVCRTQRGIWSEARSKEMTRCDVVTYTPTTLLLCAAGADDAPLNELGVCDDRRLQKLVKSELEIVWSDLLQQLPSAAQADLGRTSQAGRRFWAAMIRLWTTPITFEVTKSSTVGTSDVASRGA